MKGFAELPDAVLGALAARPDADWYRAPPGKWNSAQIVQHLAIGLESSGKAFEARRSHAAMRRRPRTARQRFAAFLMFGLRWYRSGWKAPPGVIPGEHPERDTVERQFRDGVTRLIGLERALLPARGRDLFVRHPVLGDLTLPEWLRFHVLHGRHHARQIRARLAQ